MGKKILLFFIISVVIGLVLLFTRPDLSIPADTAKQMAAQPYSHFLKWKGNEIHYTDRGTGKTLLLIHGFGGSYYNFHEIEQKLKDHYRVINIDIPGAGLSEFKQSDEEGIDFHKEYEAYFDFLIDTLNLDSIYVIGNSLGGAMAWQLAVHHPQKVQKLVLLASAGYDLEHVIVKGAGPLRFKWIKKIVSKGVPMFMVKYFVSHPFADRSKVDTAEYKYDYVLTNREGAFASMVDVAASHQYPDTNDIKMVKCPTLIIWGKEDIIIPVDHLQRFKRDIPQAQTKIYSPCGHMPQMELPDSIFYDVRKFIN
ncbi:MAG: alpha/beta hydrolase [Chitinophagales bacterium]|nr:alpha/beta hydrolase [Chitinophagales bacterium]